MSNTKTLKIVLDIAVLFAFDSLISFCSFSGLFSLPLLSFIGWLLSAALTVLKLEALALMLRKGKYVLSKPLFDPSEPVMTRFEIPCTAVAAVSVLIVNFAAKLVSPLFSIFGGFLTAGAIFAEIWLVYLILTVNKYNIFSDKKPMMLALCITGGVAVVAGLILSVYYLASASNMMDMNIFGVLRAMRYGRAAAGAEGLLNFVITSALVVFHIYGEPEEKY